MLHSNTDSLLLLLLLFDSEPSRVEGGVCDGSDVLDAETLVDVEVVVVEAAVVVGNDDDVVVVAVLDEEVGYTKE
jgi:hypothetical protein